LRVEIDLEGWLRSSGASLGDMLSKLVLGGIATPDGTRGYIGLPPAVQWRRCRAAAPRQHGNRRPTDTRPAPAGGADFGARRPAAGHPGPRWQWPRGLDLAELREALALAVQASLAPTHPIASGARMEAAE